MIISGLLRTAQPVVGMQFRDRRRSKTSWPTCRPTGDVLLQLGNTLLHNRFWMRWFEFLNWLPAIIKFSPVEHRKFSSITLCRCGRTCAYVRARCSKIIINESAINFSNCRYDWYSLFGVVLALLTIIFIAFPFFLNIYKPWRNTFKKQSYKSTDFSLNLIDHCECFL